MQKSDPISTIYTALEATVAAMMAQNLAIPRAEAWLRNGEATTIYLSSDKEGNARIETLFGGHILYAKDLPALGEKLEFIQATLAAQPSPAEREKAQFLADLAAMTERASAIAGMELVEIALRAEMMRLSENALTHQPDEPATWTEAPEVAGNGEIRNS